MLIGIRNPLCVYIYTFIICIQGLAHTRPSTNVIWLPYQTWNTVGLRSVIPSLLFCGYKVLGHLSLHFSHWCLISWWQMGSLEDKESAARIAPRFSTVTGKPGRQMQAWMTQLWRDKARQMTRSPGRHWSGTGRGQGLSMWLGRLSQSRCPVKGW